MIKTWTPENILGQKPEYQTLLLDQNLKTWQYEWRLLRINVKKRINTHFLLLILIQSSNNQNLYQRRGGVFYEHMQEFFHFSKGVLINFRIGGTASTQEIEEGLLPPVSQLTFVIITWGIFGFVSLKDWLGLVGEENRRQLFIKTVTCWYGYTNS